MIRWRVAMARLVARATPGGTAAAAALPLDALGEPGFVAIDVETTGLDPRRDALVSVAAIPFVNGEARNGYITLVHPGRPIPPASTAVHGIRDEDVAGAPGVRDVLAQVEAVCAGRIVVGHDVAFDLAMLGATGAGGTRAPWPATALCTRRLARAANPHARDSRLEVVARRLGVPAVGRHTAEGDARMAGAILLALLPTLRARGARTVADLLRLARAAPAFD